MASPSPLEITQTAEGANTVNHTVNLPAGIAAGQLLVCFVGMDGGTCTLTWPAGWVVIREASANAEAWGEVAYKIADGTEGVTMLVTSVESEQGSFQVYRFAVGDHGGAGAPPTASASVQGGSTIPDPDNLNMGVAKSYLWIAWEANDHLDLATVAPLNYTDLTSTDGGASGSANCATARRALNASAENPGTFTIAGSEGWRAATIAIQPGPTVVAVAQVTETDLAQAVAWAPKRRLVGQALETDSATSPRRIKSKAVAQVTETDSAQAVAWAPKYRLIGQVTETDSAQAVGHSKTWTIGQVLETDLSQEITLAVAGFPVDQVTETDLAQAVSSRKTKAVAQALETDLSQALTAAKGIPVAQALETDSAQAVGHSKTRTIGQVTEADLAQSVGHWKGVSVVQALEMDMAQVITAIGGALPPAGGGNPEILYSDAAVLTL